MKTLLLKTIVCFAALLPLAQVQAAGLAGKNYYSLSPGKKFTLKVTSVVSTSTDLGGGAKQVPVPTGIPKYKKNQSVRFTIGSKGELKGPGFTTPFKSATADTSVYSGKVVGPNLPNTAAVKTSLTTKTQVYTQLAFHKVTGSGLGTKVFFVVYVLE